MPDTAPQIRSVSLGEERIISVDFMGKLDSGELLSGTPSIAEVGTSLLAITNKSVSTVELVINGSSVPAGGAVQFKVAPGSLVGSYSVDILCGTTAGQTIEGRVSIRVTE